MEHNNNSYSIYDSRYGEVKEYTLTRNEKKVLDLCDSTVHLNELKKSFCNVDEVEGIINDFQEKALIVIENNRLLNLVIMDKPVESI
jgi:hypothetical protein